MRRFLCLLLVATVGLGASAAVLWQKRIVRVKPEGEMVRQEKKLSGYGALRVGSVFDVELVDGEGYPVVETNENLHEYVDVFVRGGTLILEVKQDIQFDKDCRIKVYVPAKGLTAIYAWGASRVTGKTMPDTPSLALDLSGASDVFLQGNISDLRIDASGAARLRLDVEAEQVGIEGSGAVQIQVDAEAERIRVEGRGAARLMLSGRTDELAVDGSGSAQIGAYGLQANQVSVKSSGAADIYVHAVEQIRVNASGASQVAYTGNPEDCQTKVYAAASVRAR